MNVFNSIRKFKSGKWKKYLNRHFTKIFKRPIITEKCSILLVIREIEIKTIRKDHCQLLKCMKLKRVIILSVGNNKDQLEHMQFW